jgi:hypothetical protein
MARIRTIKPEIWMAAGAGKPSFSLYCITETGSLSTGPCKVGIATNVNKRFSALQGGNPRPLLLAWVVMLPTRADALSVEQHCLAAHRPNPYSPGMAERLPSEWVAVPPYVVLETASKFLSVGSITLERAA